LGLGKPTWLVERPEQAFTPLVRGEYGTYSGMPCCDDDVLRLVDSTFDRLTLPSREGTSPPAYDEDEDGATLQGPSEVVEEAPDGPMESAEEPSTNAPDPEFEALTARRQPGRYPKAKHPRRY
jgi:hypothetical protein